MLLAKPLNKLLILRETTPPANAEVPAPAAATESEPPSQPQRTIDTVLGRGKKRRLIQLAYEIMGSPPECYPNGVSRWEGRTGTISVIHEYLGLESSRARQQIRDVLRFVQKKTEEGADDIDAGVSFVPSTAY